MSLGIENSAEIEITADGDDQQRARGPRHDEADGRAFRATVIVSQANFQTGATGLKLIVVAFSTIGAPPKWVTPSSAMAS